MMTPSEAKALGGAPHIPAKKAGSDSVSRKASFKCHVPNKTTPQRLPRKVVLPMSTVQALTFKFNELSQMNQTQKHKMTQSAVKSMLGGNGKPSTIKVVICRKPSVSRYKKADEVSIRRRVNVRKFQGSDFEEKENYLKRNVHQKVSEYEEMKKVAAEPTFNKNRTSKMQVPKILVDIDLGADNCPNHENSSNKSSAEEGNFISVRSAINLFEKTSNGGTLEKRKFSTGGKPTETSTKDVLDQVAEEFDNRTESSKEVKTKPIAAIKPILKNSDGARKTKLAPNDSINREKYSAMKRDYKKTEAEESKKELKKEEEKSGQLPSGVSERLKNNSSLHKQIRHSNFSVMSSEIPLNEDKSEEHIGNSNQNLKPNTSFLWSKKEDSEAEKRSNRIDLPLPVPPEVVPEIASPDTTYDDVGPIREESETDFDEITDSEEETYDDVGVYWKKNENHLKTQSCHNNINNNNSNNNNNNNNNLHEEVRTKNIRNEISSMKESLYDSPENCLYSYDDGEGERYQYVSDTSDSIQGISKQSEFEVYQYIQNNNNNNMNDGNEENNIYEDIQTVKAQLTGKDKCKDIYEDINCVSSPDNLSSLNCYEAVYNGIYSNGNGTQGYIKSDRSDTSNNSGRSSYEKSNSLYGMSTGNAAENPHHLSLPEITDALKNSSYHSPAFNSPHSNSETSNSDEWVSESESEETIYVVQERPKKARSGGNTWTQKERRRWKRLQKKCNLNSEEVKLQNSDDHLYESVGQYEHNEVALDENPKALSSEQSHIVTGEQIYSEEPYVDDFDSQSSEEETFVGTKLPELPCHGYNITKSLKAAGQKLRKNFSLRKSDLSKSLKRFKKSRPKLSETVFADNKVEVDSSAKAESPSTPTNPTNSIYGNNSDSSSSSHNLNKSASPEYVKTLRYRKSWTFRNKFKSNSLIETSDNAHPVDNNRNSTFYLSLNELQASEKKDDLLSEIQSVLSQRSSNSSESMSEKTDKDANLRHSDGGASLGKSRPSVPPPPPPTVGKLETAEKTKYSDLLWGEKATNNSLYVESGLFDKQKKYPRCTDSDSSLYAEIGLYAASGEQESSCRKTQVFIDEPLYQFYTECVNQRARDDILNNYDSEGYEEINDFYSVINEKRRTIDIKNVRPNFEDFNEDMRPKVTSFRSITDRRTLWCHIPAVIDSLILETLSDQAKKLQEAKFEIVTSEASYMKSLNVLENHFMRKVGDLNMISKRDFRILFSNIVAVKKCSESFLDDLEKCWEDNILLNGICDIVYKHATTSFQVYTKYCKNQVCIYRTLRELIDKNSSFESALKEMESDPICQNLNIHSFLMLPMQRITRLPLLLGAVLARLDKTDDEYDICKASFDVLNKIVQDCDDEARRMEKCEEMLILSQQIEFPKDIRRIPIITGSRFLVKSGQVTQLINRDENKLTFGKKFSKVSLTLFLFTDLLILAKKKGIRNYVVVDHCPRNLVQMQTTDGLSQLPVKLSSNTDTGGKLLMLLTMLENHEKKTAEMILSFEMESDRQRWLEAVTPKLSENPDECIYEEWDCPQVISLYEFTASQPDELNLCIGDVVNVLKKMNDGWYQGERLRDGARGWFPQNHTQEISSSHVRAKNKKLRYQLLALSGNLLDSHKVNGK